MILKIAFCLATGLAVCWAASLQRPQSLPIGTIISWNPRSTKDVLPNGWQLCNGQEVKDTSSPLAGQTLPPLNIDNLFLRGAEATDVGRVQRSSIPEHKHDALGHSHNDAGHTHEDAGHTHELDMPKIPFPVLQVGHSLGDSNGGPHWAADGFYPPFQGKMENYKADIQKGHAIISTGRSNISGVKNARHNQDETRPKNIKFPFIMKVKEATEEAIVSVIAGWLPKSGQLEASWKSAQTLNDFGLFLRGGGLEQVRQIETDSMQEHSHRDAGHSHTDLGHTHKDIGHMHKLNLGNDKTYEVLRPGGTWGDGDGGPHFGEEFDLAPKIGVGYANIQTSHTNIQSAKEVIGIATGTTTSSETRPRNMRVVFLEGETDLSNANNFPLGTILPWLSTMQGSLLLTGWVECDGTTYGVPNLNVEGRFLRGGSLDQAGLLEESTLQQHNHEDQGHLHIDSGHTHEDAGHRPDLREYKVLIPGSAYGDGDAGGKFAKEGIIEVKIGESKAEIGTANANFEVAKAVILGVVGADVAAEVRPSNMGVKYIMRVF